MTHIVTPINEINNPDRPLPGHHCFILNPSDPCPSVAKKRLKHISCTLYDRAPAQQLPPRGHETLDFGRLPPGRPYYTLSLPEPCPKRRLTKKQSIHYITYLATPQHRIPAPGAMKSTILADPSPDIITVPSACPIRAWE